MIPHNSICFNPIFENFTIRKHIVYLANKRNTVYNGCIILSEAVVLYEQRYCPEVFSGSARNHHVSVVAETLEKNGL